MDLAQTEKEAQPNYASRQLARDPLRLDTPYLLSTQSDGFKFVVEGRVLAGSRQGQVHTGY